MALGPELPAAAVTVNHSPPSGPGAIAPGCSSSVRPAVYSVNWPVVGSSRAIWPKLSVVSQRFPSGPLAMSCAKKNCCLMGTLVKGMPSWVIIPDGVTRPIEVAPAAATQRFPSGPAVIPVGRLAGKPLPSGRGGKPGGDS
jgi:hypothetical protein